jgi:hexokinase
MGKNSKFIPERELLQTVVAGHSLEGPELHLLRKSFTVLDPFVLRKVYLNFLKELQAGLRDEQSSLPFILHDVSSSAFVHSDEAFQVMVIGGSVFRTAMIRKSGNEFLILDTAEEPLPTFLTKNDFLQFVDSHVNKQISTLAVNFAYPLRPVFENGKADGVLLSAMKEHTFEGLIGERIGKTIEEYFAATYRRKLTVALANDTVCLLLSGLTQHASTEIAGGIVGTGTNFALFLDDGRLVNLESANFDKFPLSDELKLFDAESQSPGKALFEKETAGGYLYKHFNVFLKQNQLPYPALRSTLELKQLAEKNTPFLSDLALLLVEKSAALIAAEITAISVFKANPELVFVMDGSFFWDDLYQNFVQDYLSLLNPGQAIRFVKIDNGIYLGGAKLVA